MAEKVGELYYDVTLETGQMIDGQRKVDKEIRKTTDSLDRFEAKLTQITNAIKLYATALALVKAAEMADDIRLMGARVEVAAGNVDAGVVAMQRLVAISRETQTSVEANVNVFTRLNQSILQMGGTQNDTLRITELLGKAIKVSGASAVEAKSAMIQFGQALGSGKLSGDELRALLETAPYLMRQLADGLGVPVGALKKLGEEGKLTADVVVNAMSKAAARIDADFAKMPQTLSGAFAVARDAAERANEKFDQLSGTSNVLTGMTKGLGEVLDKLADQFGAANREAGNLGRNDAINNWANTTKIVLSYVVDAADFVARGFKQMGIALGGVAAALSGDFARARSVMSTLLEDIKAVNKETLAGQKMRNLWAAGAGGGRGVVNPAPASSTLTPPPGSGDKKAGFDAAGYIAGLTAAANEGFAKVDAVEQAALAKNAELLAKKKINAEQAAKAITLIEQRAAKDRLDLQEGLDKKIQEALDKDADLEERKAHARAQAAILLTDSTERQIALSRDEAVRQAEESYRRGKTTFEEMELAKLQAAKAASDQMRALEASRDQYVVGTMQMRAGTTGGADDQIALIRAQAAAQLLAVQEAQARDLENTQMYADRKVAIVADMNQKILDVETSAARAQYSALGDASDQLLAMLEKAGKEKTAIGKAAFLASKAIAVAEIIMNTEVAAAKAAGQLGIFGLPMATVIRAAGYASAGMVAGMAIGEVVGGRQYGGPVSSGSLYRVNETGAPEMFTGSNGNQYMLPTKSGQVTPANKAGGGKGWTINVHNAPPGTTTSVNDQQRTIDIAVGRAVAEVSRQLAENDGPVWRGARTGSSIKPRLS